MTWRHFGALMVAVLLLIGGTQTWAAGTPDPTTEPALALAVQTEEEVDTPAITEDEPDLEGIKQKQKDLVDELCLMVDDTAEFVTGQPSLAALAPGIQAQQAKCDIAKDAVDDVTVEEIRAASMKRGASATVFAEYTGPDRDVENGSDEPSWEPGMPTLEGVEYLGKDYNVDGSDGNGICAAKPGVGNATVETSEASAAEPKGHGKMLKGYTEWCAEVIGDGIGDDDGFCEEQDKGKAKFEEACVEVALSLDDIDADDENFDDDTLHEFDALLDDALSSVEAARIAASGLRATFEANRTLEATDGFCADPKDRSEGSQDQLMIVHQAANATETIMNTVFYIAGQTIVAAGFGGNASAAFGVLAVANGVANGFAQGYEVIADVDTATNVISTLECLDEFWQASQGEMQKLSEQVASLARVSLQVLELKEKSSYLIAATIAGEPTSAVVFTSVKASQKSPLDFVELAAGDWTVTEITGAPGTYQLDLTLPSSLRNADLFTFEVEFAGDDGPVYGHVVFDRSLMGGTGQ